MSRVKLIVISFLCWISFPLLSQAQEQTQDLKKIVALGDSLSSGYQLGETEGFVPTLQQSLLMSGIQVTVINAAVAGDTTSEGVVRVGWVLKKYQPDLVIVELGANDMLRGLNTESIYHNLDYILNTIQSSGAQIVLAGMLASPNLGVTYAKQFSDVYQRLAKEYNTPFFPFFLQDVANNAQFNLADGIHPNSDGIQVIVKNITPLIISTLSP